MIDPTTLRTVLLRDYRWTPAQVADLVRRLNREACPSGTNLVHHGDFADLAAVNTQARTPEKAPVAANMRGTSRKRKRAKKRPKERKSAT